LGNKYLLQVKKQIKWKNRKELKWKNGTEFTNGGIE